MQKRSTQASFFEGGRFSPHTRLLPVFSRYFVQNKSNMPRVRRGRRHFASPAAMQRVVKRQLLPNYRQTLARRTKRIWLTSVKAGQRPK